MAARPCLGCGRLTNPGPRCPTCTQARQRATDSKRGTAAQRGYDSAWRRLVRQAMQVQAMVHGHAHCVDCGHRGSEDNPLSGDHLRWPARTLDDVEIVCRVCNSRRPNRRSGVVKRQ